METLRLWGVVAQNFNDSTGDLCALIAYTVSLTLSISSSPQEERSIGVPTLELRKLSLRE